MWETDIPESASFLKRDEYKMMRKLENYLPWYIRLNMNANRKGIDIEFHRVFKVRRHEKANPIHVKKHQGYIELERADKWKSGKPPTELPDNWGRFSFLERKLSEWDGGWEGPIKDIGRTIYLKFNNDMDECFSASNQYIWENGKVSRRGDGSYNGTFRELHLDDENVHCGLEESVEFMVEKMNDVSPFTSFEDSDNYVSYWKESE